MLAVVAVALGARIDVPVPGSPVPQSLQTLAVVLVGALFGPVRGAVALCAYLAAGAVGLPVFAGGAAGIAALVGPTAGYLWSFPVGAALAGLAARPAVERGVRPGALLIIAGALAAHAAVLAAGSWWLSTRIGADAAWSSGVAPFLWGAVVKSALAGGLWAALRARTSGR